MSKTEKILSEKTGRWCRVIITDKTGSKGEEAITITIDPDINQKDELDPKHDKGLFIDTDGKVYEVTRTARDKPDPLLNNVWLKEL